MLKRTNWGNLIEDKEQSCTVLKSLHTGFGVPAEEVKWVRSGEVEPESSQHPQLHLTDLRGAVGVVSDVDEVTDLRRVDFLDLAGDKHGSHSHQLQFLSADGGAFALQTRGFTFIKSAAGRGKSHLEELVNDVYSHVERLLQQLELGVDLHQPVYQHSPHLTIDRTPGGR